MGTKAITAAVQLDFPCRLSRCARLASLAGGGAGRLFVSSLERVFVANDLYGNCHFAQATSTYDGSGGAIDGEAGADDARPVDRWMADYTVWVGRRSQGGVVVLRWARGGDDGFSVVDGG